jgi:hypothetical protein
MAIVNNVDIYPTADDFGGIVFLNMAVYDPESHHRLIVKSVEMEPINDAVHYWEPPISMSRENAQALMDRLWNIGLRPSEGTGSAGALAATQAHLDDMRQIAFDLLNRQVSQVLAVFEESTDGPEDL